MEQNPQNDNEMYIINIYFIFMQFTVIQNALSILLDSLQLSVGLRIIVIALVLCQLESKLILTVECLQLPFQ